MITRIRARPVLLVVFAVAVVLLTPHSVRAQITLEETVTGGSTGSSPVDLPSVQGGTNQTYVLVVVTHQNKEVTAVTGAALTWTEQVEQCGLIGKHGIRLWTARGSPSTSFQVQIVYDGTLPLTAVLTRYSGANSIIDATGANLNGENDTSCAAGQNDTAQLTLSSITDGSVHVIGIAPGNRTVDSSSPGYTQAGTDAYGNGGNLTRAYVFEQLFATASTDSFDASLSGNYWWTTAGVVLSTAEPITPIFEDVSVLVGFDLQTTTTDNKPSGLHFADFDDDGDLDSIITGDSSSRYLSNLNVGQSFTSTAFGGGSRPGQGAMIDIDNEGDLDFWHADEVLFDNNGTASFSDAGALGFISPTATSGVATADVNNDGYADLLMFSTNGNWIGFHDGKVAPTISGTDDPSYGFVDSGSVGNGGFVAASDVNNDGRLDFYYHYNGGKLFLSQGDGTFVQNASGISVSTAPNKPVGATFGDYDNDGDVDLFVPQYDSGSFGYLWRNDGGTFTDVAFAAGIMNSSGQRGAAFGDYDNDGDLDLYIGVDGGANVVYENQGDGTFIEVFVGAGTTGETQDVVFVDYDNDGDLDLAMTQEGATNVLLRNTTNSDTYLKVRVIGHGAAMTNKAAIGVRVELYEADGTTFLARREIGVASGFGGTEPLWVHFGGVDPTATYVVKAYMTHEVLSASVVPNEVSTTIGPTTIAQMFTFEEPAPRLAGWREIDPR